MFPNIPMLPPVPSPVATAPHRELELQVGDLCVWCGKQYEHSTYKNRIIYRVVEKKWVESTTHPGTGYHSVRFVVAFDLENPVGRSLDPIGFANIREMKKLSLVDLGIIRLALDNFILEWAKSQGMSEPQYDAT